MRLGETTMSVYWSKVNSCKVIKTGACGDNVGYVQNIQSLEEFKTYGYNSMEKVGDIDVCVSITKQP